LKFKVDENVPLDVAEYLNSNGLDTLTVFDESLAGCTDQLLADHCKNENRILLTLDTDFADIRQYSPHQLPGMIVFRLKHQDRNSVLEATKRMLPFLAQEPLEGHLWIVEEHRIRIRK
jgi:predicted nuclease of predicted toxin-antitoxin system